MKFVLNIAISVTEPYDKKEAQEYYGSEEEYREAMREYFNERLNDRDWWADLYYENKNIALDIDII